MQKNYSTTSKVNLIERLERLVQTEKLRIQGWYKEDVVLVLREIKKQIRNASKNSKLY